MLQSMELQRVGHDLEAEQQQIIHTGYKYEKIPFVSTERDINIHIIQKKYLRSNLNAYFYKASLTGA